MKSTRAYNKRLRLNEAAENGVAAIINISPNSVIDLMEGDELTVDMITDADDEPLEQLISLADAVIVDEVLGDNSYKVAVNVSDELSGTSLYHWICTYTNITSLEEIEEKVAPGLSSLLDADDEGDVNDMDDDDMIPLPADDDDDDLPEEEDFDGAVNAIVGESVSSKFAKYRRVFEAASEVLNEKGEDEEDNAEGGEDDFSDIFGDDAAEEPKDGEGEEADAEGGEDKIRYGIGLSVGNVGGVMQGSDRQTLEGNVDLIYRTGKFQFSNKLSINWLDVSNPTVSFAEYAYANPYYRKYNALGGVDKYLYYPEEGVDDYPVSNPLWNAHLNNWDIATGFGFTNNFIFEWFMTESIRLRAKFGLTKQDDDEQTRLSPQHTQFDDMGETEKGLYSHTQIKELVYEGDVAVTYGKLWAEKHMVNAVGGFNFSNNRRQIYGYSATGFTDDQFDAPSFANGYPVGGSPDYSESLKRAASFYINGGYAYAERYLVDFNYRLDGASMFGTGNRFRNTWSLGVGWNIHKEDFMKSLDFFSLVKLRGSVGNPGNQNFSAYQAFSTYKFNGWMTNIFGTGVILNALGNTELAWQETTNYDIGTDMTFWGDRVNISFDYYWKHTDPLLAIITTPGSMGVTSVAMNAGSQKTQGWEAILRISPIYRPSEGINWNISINATSSRSVYANIGDSFSALNESGKASLAGTTRYYDGGSPTAIWAVRSAGIDPATGRELFIRKDGTYSFTYDVNDEVVVGDIQPKVEGLVGTSLYFKGLSVGCYFRYRWGGQVFNSSLFQKVENIGTQDVYNNQDKRALYDRWSESNREAYFKGISLVQKTEKSSRFVMDDNSFVGESFNIGYEFPDRIARRMRLGAFNVQMTMTDVFRATSVRVERGIDYPFARTVTMSLGVTF